MACAIARTRARERGPDAASHRRHEGAQRLERRQFDGRAAAHLPAERIAEQRGLHLQRADVSLDPAVLLGALDQRLERAASLGPLSSSCGRASSHRTQRTRVGRSGHLPSSSDFAPRAGCRRMRTRTSPPPWPARWSRRSSPGRSQRRRRTLRGATSLRTCRRRCLCRCAHAAPAPRRTRRRSTGCRRWDPCRSRAPPCRKEW